MRAVVAGVLMALTIAGPASAQAVVQTVDWSRTSPLSGTLEDGVVVVDAGPGTHPLTVIRSPQVTGADILVTVEISWDGLDQPGFLELWAVLDDGSRFFSRTLDATGEGVMKSSGSGTLQLPFFLDGAVPAALELNVVLPSGGRVEIGSVELIDFGISAQPESDDAWWTAETAGIVGGVGGAIVGLFGAAIGTLTSRQRARGLVIGGLKGGAAVGVILLGLGLVALTTGQPYEVWFLLLLTGVIMAAVFGGLIGQVTARYEATELQRMRAHDLV